MAKKTKKSAEPAIPEPTSPELTSPESISPVPTGSEPAGLGSPTAAGLNPVSPEPAPEEKSEAELDKEAEHRMQGESPALPDDSEAEAEAQAADTFEDAYEPANLGHKGAKTGAASEANAEAKSETDDAEEADEDEDQAESSPKPHPPAKLERLQKILAQAGVSSRRRAEELIEQGRVQVNGKIVTELGTKADAGRDHIRVDGKLLHGAERLRYFVLNKPKGFVTTVKDPEGRPTVMQFFEKMAERLYPVGRLDYQTEGLLLVTNDGELANKLTKAASGVEKTYLVKVSGQPTEDELDVLRGGVAIEKGKPGMGRVRTAPARIRQVRQGDNPWYEVVLIEGRNRELRKMFEEIGHFVEKIRRVGYGPLVLDQEPGNFRELEAEELELLRKAADGKLRTPKSKDVRRRNAADAGKLPTVLPRPSGRPSQAQPYEDRTGGAGRAGQYPPKKSFGPSGDRDQARPSRPTRPPGEGFRPAAGRPGAAPQRFGAGKPPAGKFDSGKPRAEGNFAAGRPAPGKFAPARPVWKKDDRPETRPPARFDAAEGADNRRGAYRGGQNTAGPGAAGRGRTSAERPFSAKPAWDKTRGNDRPKFERPSGPRRNVPPPDDEVIEKRTGLHIEPIEAERPSTRSTRPSRPSSAPPRFDRAASARPSFDKPRSAGPRTDRPASNRAQPAGSRFQSDRPRFDKPRSDKPRFDKPRFDKPRFDKPGFSRPRPGEGSATTRPGGPSRPPERPSGSTRPPRGEGLARPFTTSSGIPRAGGARPSSKLGRPAGRTFGGRSGSGSSAGAGSGSRPAGKTGWKPKPNFGGAGKPASGGKSRPSSGPRGASKSGPRSGGKKPGPGGKRY